MTKKILRVTEYGAILDEKGELIEIEHKDSPVDREMVMQNSANFRGVRTLSLVSNKPVNLAHYVSEIPVTPMIFTYTRQDIYGNVTYHALISWRDAPEALADLEAERDFDFEAWERDFAIPNIRTKRSGVRRVVIDRHAKKSKKYDPVRDKNQPGLYTRRPGQIANT